MAFAHAQLVPPGSREIRVGSDTWVYGDPYDWCCIAKPIGEGTVELSLRSLDTVKSRAARYRRARTRGAARAGAHGLRHGLRPRNAQEAQISRGLLMRSRGISLTDRESSNSSNTQGS